MGSTYTHFLLVLSQLTLLVCSRRWFPLCKMADHIRYRQWPSSTGACNAWSVRDPHALLQYAYRMTSFSCSLVCRRAPQLGRFRGFRQHCGTGKWSMLVDVPDRHRKRSVAKALWRASSKSKVVAGMARSADQHRCSALLDPIRPDQLLPRVSGSDSADDELGHCDVWWRSDLFDSVLPAPGSEGLQGAGHARAGPLGVKPVND